MPSPHSFCGLRVILIVSTYFHMDMNCFRLVRVVSSYLRVCSVAADSFGWVFADGFGWLRMVSGDFGWFAVLVVTIQNGRSESDFIFLQNLITELNELIFSTKASYYENIGKN